MGPIGAQEMIFIFVLALLLFGPKKLPELGRMLGKGLTEFRRAKNELKSTFESHMQELERETKLSDEATKPKWEQSSSSTQYSSASYPYPYDEYGRQSPSEGATVPPDSEIALNSSAGANGTHAEPVPGTVPRSASAHVAEGISTGTEESRPA